MSNQRKTNLMMRRLLMITNKVKPVISVFIILILVLITAFAGTKSEIDTKGIVTYTEGSVKKRNLQQQDWQAAVKNTEVIGGDRVRTYLKSRAELELAKVDLIRLAPQTTVDVLKLYEETEEQQRETQIVLQNGGLWANVSKKSEELKFNIGTPIAGMAVTGTVLRTEFAADSSTELRVYNGVVVLTNAPERTDLRPTTIKPFEIKGPHEIPGPREVTLEEWAVIVKSMQRVKVGKDGQIVDSGEFSKSDNDEQSEWVKWNLERDRQKLR